MTLLEQLKLSIKEAKVAPGMPVKLVAIDGHGGAGKSRLATHLSQELHAEIIRTDDFASMENPLDWWPRLIDEVLDPIKAGAQALSYKRSSWWENHNPSPIIDQFVTPVMILEGVSASRSEFRPYLAYSIWVEAPKEVYQVRGIDRDLASNPDGKSRQELEGIWEKWHTYENMYIKRDNPKGYANRIVDGTKNYA